MITVDQPHNKPPRPDRSRHARPGRHDRRLHDSPIRRSDIANPGVCLTATGHGHEHATSTCADRTVRTAATHLNTKEEEAP